MTVQWDASELDRYVGSFDAVPAKTVAAATAVVLKGAVNITKTARQLASGLGHAPHYPRSIGWDWIPSLTGIEAEIGPDKDKTQGALGNILEYGTSKNPPYAHLGPATDREIPNFVREGDRIGGQVLDG